MTEDEYERVFWEAERQFREIICGDRLMWLNNQGIARIRQALPGGSVLDEKRARGAQPTGDRPFRHGARHWTAIMRELQETTRRTAGRG